MLQIEAVSKTVDPISSGVSIIASVLYLYFLPAFTSLKNLSSIAGTWQDCSSNTFWSDCKYASQSSSVADLELTRSLTRIAFLSSGFLKIGAKHSLKIFPPSRPMMSKSIFSSIGLSSKMSVLVQYFYQEFTNKSFEYE